MARRQVSGIGRRVVTALAVGTLALAAATVAGTTHAAAAPGCPQAVPARLVGTVPGAALEGLTVDGGGRLYTTDVVSGQVFRIDAPGAGARPIARVPSGGAGALAWTPDGTLLVGYGADARVAVGDSVRPGAIARLDTATTSLRPWVSGLSAANGMAVSDTGTVYATNDFGTRIGRISPTGTVDAAWASLPSANGAVLSNDDRWLYVSRTFVNPGVSRISTAHPRVIQNLLTLQGADALAAPDGLTLDSHGRPVIPFNAAGQIVRLTAPGSYCILAQGLPMSSVVSYGRGDRGFSAGRLFRAGFDGRIYEIPAGFDAGSVAAFPAR